MALMDFMKSKEEKEQRSKDYLELLFPLGIEQRDKIKEILDDMYPKYKNSNMLFNYIVAKEKFVNPKEIEKKTNLTSALKFIKRIRPRLKEADVNFFLKFIEFDANIQSISDYPDITIIKTWK